MYRQEQTDQTPQVTEDQLRDEPAARARLKATHARMYKWPAMFAGYQAALQVNDDGQLCTGAVTIIPKQPVVIHLEADETLQTWIQERLSTQTMHLAYTP